MSHRWLVLTKKNPYFAFDRLAFDALIDSGIGFIDTAEGGTQGYSLSAVMENSVIFL
jgi:hypothetical protein